MTAATAMMPRGPTLAQRLEDVTDDEMALLGWVRTSSHTGRLRLALRDLLGLVVDRTMCGHWRGDPEIEPEVQRARAALLDRGLEEQVGWIRWDGDEYHDFRYASTTDRARTDLIVRAGYWPVYARRFPD